MKPRIFAFYLPQYHPIKENNEWFGTGFTEWTNVGKAKPLFKGHYQPRVPADLGYYDLRVSEVREQQAQLAKEAGIEGFCYYHYWFGNGKTIMEYPLREVIKTKSPDFPFCLCWANHDWFKKEWNPSTKTLKQHPLFQMVYPGIKDAEAMFYHYLPVFQDSRYIKIDGKLVYVILDITSIPFVNEFKKKWNQLANDNGLPPFFFIAYTTKVSDLSSAKFRNFDSSILELVRNIEFKQNFSRFNMKINYLKNIFGGIINRPQYVYEYKDALPFLLNSICTDNNFIPTLIPNWDWSPRRGAGGLILNNSTPAFFKEHVKKALDLIKNKPDNRKIIFLKSWNEWGEGNYMEPDLKFGHGYIDALREAIDELK